MRLLRIIFSAAILSLSAAPMSAWTERLAGAGAERLEIKRGKSAVVETDAAFVKQIERWLQSAALADITCDPIEVVKDN